MSKKKKATAKKPSPERAVADEIRELDERIAERSLAVVRECVAVIDTLDGLLADAHCAFSTHPDRRDGVLGFDEVHKLDMSLFAVDNRLARVELEPGFDPFDSPRSAIAELRKCFAFSREKPSRDSATVIARAIQAVEILRDFELDRARRRMRATYRPPSGVEAKILRVLLASPIGLDAATVGKKIGTNRNPVEPKPVWDAVERLRLDCGFEIPNPGTGYRLTDADRARASDYGISVGVNGVETE
jgi:hypothetical protein